MTDLFRILVVVFLGLHGVGHVIWFLAAWTRVGSGFGEGRWILPGDVTIRSPLGRLWGIVALLVMLLFVAAAMALLSGSLTWRSLANTGVILSLGVVVPWARQAPGWTAINAIIADLVLMVLIALPLSVDMVGGG
jgi:hypothetical protein